jgi:hypothetical protein
MKMKTPFLPQLYEAFQVCNKTSVFDYESAVYCDMKAESRNNLTRQILYC